MTQPTLNTMRPRHCLLLILLPCCLAIFDGCRWRHGKADEAKDYTRPLAEGALALREVSSDQLPDLVVTSADRGRISQALEHSLTFLSRSGSQRFYPIAGIAHDDVQRSVLKLRDLIRSTGSDTELNAAIRRDFRVYMSVGCDDAGTVQFTGYYTPIFAGSLTQDDRYRYPLYKRPADLLSGQGDQVALQQLPNGSTRPYPSRADLETSGTLHGQELVWLTDPFETYIVQVQGSGKIRLPSGEVIDVGYDGTNNHRYHPIAEDLIADGKILKKDLSLATMRTYFRSHPEDVATYSRRNPRYIFFTRTKGGPFGSLGQPVVTDVSVATDKSIFPPGAPIIVSTTASDAGGTTSPYAAIRVDQDTGGAIRAPGRCDLYMGEGPTAERRAGQQMAEGRLYYLIAR